MVREVRMSVNSSVTMLGDGRGSRLLGGGSVESHNCIVAGCLEVCDVEVEDQS